MNLCYFCRYSVLQGKGCGLPELSGFLGNKFPTGIRIQYCQRFSLLHNTNTDVKIKVGPNQVKINYNSIKKF